MGWHAGKCPPGFFGERAIVLGTLSAGGLMDHGAASCSGFTIRNATAQHARAIAVIQVDASWAAYGRCTRRLSRWTYGPKSNVRMEQNDRQSERS